MARRSKAVDKNLVRVDFTGVEAGGKLTPPGEYIAEVVKAEEKESENKKPYISWTLRVLGDPAVEGNRLYYNTSLQPQALWNLRQFLEAMGVETKPGPMSLDLASYKGLQLGVEVDLEKYNGKDRSRVVDAFALTDEEDEEEESDEEDENVGGDEEDEEVEEDEEEGEEESDDASEESEDADEDDSEEEEEKPAPRRRSGRARR